MILRRDGVTVARQLPFSIATKAPPVCPMWLLVLGLRGSPLPRWITTWMALTRPVILRWPFAPFCAAFFHHLPLSYLLAHSSRETMGTSLSPFLLLRKH
ncbi:uncharacterized protein EI90DRAFT_3060071 [Cantharellus anzutake]|uniref:uncharacterized protein n=2 Tax=Cantharellus anzutake TaxID=1750568 RepID=UPI00190621A0|nr:uncharacterized protein EI90DRAFT_3060071 [Cantharellus anzutake]KAF8330589.1 hypothetical protein EI90DRAFT_3060071 [Cantharellus anzutake]